MKLTVKQVLLVTALVGAACEGNPPPLSNAKAPVGKSDELPKMKDGEGTKVAAPVPPPPTLTPPPAPVPSATVVGMTEPFKLMNAASLRTLDMGWKAMRRKDWDEARAAFHEVVMAYPDKPAARFAELRATALAGDFAAVPALWRELLARDFVGYAGRLDGGKEMAPLRKSPQWAQVKSITTEMKARHLAALERGFFFVGRLRPAGAVLTGAEVDGESVKLSLEQEVYHYDPGSERIQRVSDSGGTVLGLHHDGEQGKLMVLTGGALKKTGGALAFAAPQASVIALDTLERTGPLPIDADATSVELCFSSKGEPVWAAVFAGLRDERALTLDATRTSLVGSEEGCGGRATTAVKPNEVSHRMAALEGVSLSEDGLRIMGVDEDVPVRASSAIRPESLAWSPGKKRFVYTGSFGVCERPGVDAAGKAEASNGVYVWDPERKRSTRVSAAASALQATFLDDDRLAYQGGPRATKLTIHDLLGGGATVVKVPAGVGLYGIATVGCEEAQLTALSQE
jgi:hypothetical protein